VSRMAACLSRRIGLCLACDAKRPDVNDLEFSGVDSGRSS
jgi:hypothetical protein